MKKLSLLFLAFLTLVIVYVYLPLINPGTIKQKKEVLSENNKQSDAQNTFIKPEYIWKTGDGSSLTIKSEIAFQNKEDPHILDLEEVYSFSTLNDGSIIKLTSGKAIYNRKSQNIVYYNNVKIINKDMSITSENAEYVTKNNLLTLYGNVKVKKNNDFMTSDSVTFNTATKNLKFSMKDKNKKVYGKKTKN